MFNNRMLRAWRLEDGRRPEQVCVEASMSFSYLRRLEDGTASNPTASVLARLAAADSTAAAEAEADRQVLLEEGGADPNESKTRIDRIRRRVEEEE